nr:retrovirus-related Pol polyprotein from transposon TNT 1-94 [Tanacetum cinerariifolium]
NLMACNNSDTRSAFDCNNARNALCNARLNASVDVNDLFVFDDVSIRKYHVSKMLFRKKPSASLNVSSRSKLNKSLPRIVRCSKHMTSNRALLTNFVKKFLGTVRFGNNDFAVIAGYGDVQNGVVERKNQTLVEAARTMLTFANLPLFLLAEAIATACFTQNRLIIHNNFNKTPYELMNKKKPNIKFFYLIGCRCYLLNDYDDVGKLKIMKSSTMNVETSNVEIHSHEEEVFHESSESFQEESSSSSLNENIQQSLEEVRVPSSNTQSFSNDMIPNDDVASTSHNVFNERLEDAYFDASTSIEPANMAEALKDTDWVITMQDELDQFARLKVWRLVPKSEDKNVIKTKWIFKNKKDESSLVIRNKARLVAVGYSQQEGIDYDET